MKNTGFIKIILSLLFVVIIFSCSESGDKRKDLVKSYGQPDYTEKSELGTYKYLIYVYARKDLNRVYYLRQSGGAGCGGNNDYYIYAVYYADEAGYELYMPPTITHTPVTTAPAGNSLQLFADVTDDNEVQSVVLYYMHKALADTTQLNMYTVSADTSLYKGTIPASFMTEGEIDYYILATDDEAYTTRLPKKGLYAIKVSTTTKSVVSSPEPESSAISSKKARNFDISGESSPVAP